MSERNGTTPHGSLGVGRIWGGFVFGTFPFGFSVAAIFGANGVTFTVGLLVYVALWVVAYTVAWWRDFGVKPGVLWDEGVPVKVASSQFERDFDVTWHTHAPSCAVNVTGHSGPCTCGGRRG